MLRIFQHRYLRIMCRVTLAQSHNFRINNEELQRSLNLRTINDYVTKNQLRRTSHGALISFDRLFKKILSSQRCTKNLVGVPEYTYGLFSFNSLKKAGINLNNWYELAHDKTKWRKMIYVTAIIYYSLIFFPFLSFCLFFFFLCFDSREQISQTNSLLQG